MNVLQSGGSLPKFRRKVKPLPPAGNNKPSNKPTKYFLPKSRCSFLASSSILIMPVSQFTEMSLNMTSLLLIVTDMRTSHKTRCHLISNPHFFHITWNQIPLSPICLPKLEINLFLYREIPDGYKYNGQHVV